MNDELERLKKLKKDTDTKNKEDSEIQKLKAELEPTFFDTIKNVFNFLSDIIGNLLNKK